MFFARPVFLWLLLVLPVVIWWHRRRRLGAGPVRHVVLAALRIGAVGCAVLALARPILRVHERRAVHVDVVDVSSSLSDHDIEETARRVRERRREAAASGTDEYALVVFDARPRLVETPANGPTGEWLVAQRDASGVAGSRIADALRFAASLVGEGSVGHVVLYSDGLETGGDARAAALHLGQRGPTLTTEVVGARRDGALVLRAVDGPAGARIGETIEPTFRVGSSRAGSARLVVRDADTGEVVLSSTRAIRAGVQTITAPIELRRVGTLSFDATIEADWDSYTKNNERTFAVAVNPAMRVAVVEAGANAPAAAVLSEWLAPGSVVSSLTPRELAADTHALDGVNLLVLGDVPPDELPAPAMRAIDGAVERGLGLLVAGGRRAFGRGGYRDTELARIVPVDFSDTMERRDPSVTLVIVIDTSGSMTGPRMAIAQAVARLAMQRLQAHDKVGIVEFYGSKRWAARIQSAANAIDINRALNRLSAGGGTVILPAIEEAYYALLNVRTRLKHVLIVTDGGVETGPFQSVITRMADANITVTTVAAGTAQYSTFLSDLAHWGRGRFYAAPDRFHLPEIILKQPESVPSSPFVEEPSRIEPAVSLPMFEGIDFDRWPALEGYVRASTKPTGRTWLRSSLGDPVLASWRYGRGSVDVMTTDLGGAWSAALAGSPDWARLMSNVVRQTASPTSTEGFEIRPLRRGAGIELAIRYVGRDAIDPSTALELTIRDPEGTTTRRPVDPYLPGRWNALVAEPQRGVYRFSVRAPGIRASGHAAIAIDPPREVPAIAPDETLMGDLAKLAAEAPTEATHAAAVRYLDLWPWFTLAAIAALLAHVLIRRWPWWGRMPAVTALLVGAYIWGGDTSPAFALGVAETQTTRGVASASGNALEAARQALREGHIAQARSVLQTHVAAGEARAEAWSLLARCCELLGDNDAASDALGKALEMTADPDQRFVLAVRRIGLAFDSGNADAGRGRLQRLADETSDPARRLFCGRLAALWGESALAARLLAPGDAQSEDPRDWLIAGLVASRAGLADDAAASYERAARALRTRRDRAYAIDRLIDTARRQGTAGALADRWLNTPDLSAEHLMPLVRLLRELGRVDDALSLLERGITSPGGRVVVESDEFRSEVVKIALEAGEVAVAKRLFVRLMRASDNPLRWRTALGRLLVRQGQRSDAVALFKEALAATDTSDGLFALADASKDLALDEIGLAAMDKAAALGPEPAYRAALWRAELADKRGDRAHAIETLNDAAALAKADAGHMRELADAYERYGQPSRAIAVLRDLAEQEPDAETLERLAWLLERTGQLTEARTIWQRLWKESTSAARRQHAGARLLELSAKTGTLADLAIELERRLAAGDADASDLSLLVDLYTQVEDDVATAEVLYLFAERSGDQVGALRLLAQAYLSMGRLAQTDAILDQLCRLDPQRAEDYWQERMVLAVERQRPRDAEHAIEQLSAIAGEESIASELAAGVWAMLGAPEKAASLYGQVLDRHPDRIELWLLWANAMRDAQRADEAIARLQWLAEEAQEDDLFLVAVDGLLNLEAPRIALQSVLRRLGERIAAAPSKIYLYDAAGDVLESVGRADHVNDWMELAVAYAGEQRGALLREMMARAKAADDRARLIDYGDSLLALDYMVPPEAFLDLGEALLAENRRVAAERAFDRACALGEYVTVRRKVAEAYEQAMMPGPAQRIVAELLATDPEDVSLLHQNGGLFEQLGQYGEAFAQYQHAMEVLLQRIPRVATASGTPSVGGGGRRRRIAADVDVLTQYYEPTVVSLVSCARSSELRARLFAFLDGEVRAELEAIRGSDTQPGPGETYVRLERLAASLRYAAFALHQPDVADKTDRALCQRLPNAERLRTEMLQERVRWGLVDRAVPFVSEATSQANEVPVDVVLRRLVEDADRRTALLDAETMDGDLAARVVPALIFSGEDEEAKRWIVAALDRVREPSAEAARRMMVACVALDDPALLGRWALRYFAACRRIADRRSLLAAVECGVRVAWPLVSDADRRAILDALNDLTARVRQGAVELRLHRLRLAESLGIEPRDREETLKAAVQDPARRITERVETLLRARPEERPALLEHAWTASKPNERLNWLMTVAGMAFEAPGPEFAAVFRRLLDASPPLRLDRYRPFGELTAPGWHTNTVQPELGVVVAEHLLGQLPDEAPVLAAAASAYRSAGDARRAADLAASALRYIIGARKLNAEAADMIDTIVRSFPNATCAETGGRIRDAQAAGGVSLIELYVGAVCYTHLEQEAAARELFQAAMRRSPDQTIVRRRLIGHFESLRDWGAIIDALSPYTADRAILQSYELSRLANAYRMRYEPIAALDVLERDGTAVISRIGTLSLEAALGRVDRIENVLRRYLIVNRREQRFYSPLESQPPMAGGIQEYLQRADPEFPRRRSLFVSLASIDPAVAELDALWQSAVPDRHDVPGLIEARLEAAASRGELDAVASTLAQRLEDGSFQARDLRLLTALVAKRETTIGTDALRRLAARLICVDPSQVDTLRTWAQLALRHGDNEQAAAVLRWVVAQALTEPRDGLNADRRFRDWALYFAALPEARRTAEQARLARATQRTPIEEPGDSFDALRLRDVVTAEGSKLGETCLSRLEAALAAQSARAFYPRAHRACAWAHAMRGDLDAFTPHVERLLELCDRTYGNFHPPDASQFLPSSNELREPGAYVDAVERAVTSRVDREALSPTDAVRTLALLGYWCARSDLQDRARALLERTMPLAGDQPCERWLWIMDLADAVDPARGLSMGETTMRAGRLPIRRMEPTLERIEAASGQQAADAVALIASETTNLPAVLRRALRAARAGGERDRAAELEQKLQQLEPHGP